MKQDKFDDFIKNHRQLFDDIEPAPPAFKTDRKVVSAYKVKTLYALWAASIAVIMVLSFLLLNQSSKIQQMEYVGLSINKKILNFELIKNTQIDNLIEESNEIEINLHKTPKQSKIKDFEPEKNIIVEELIEANTYYTQEIQLKQNELLLLTSSTPQIYQTVYSDITELEKIYSELYKDLDDDIDNKQVIEAMIQNYRLRLMILEGVVNQIKNQTINNNNTQGYEF